MKICIAGEGAIAQAHLDALAAIEDVEVVSIAGGDAGDTAALAKARGIPHWTLDLAESLARPGVEAAILATPTPIHARQTEQVLRAGKHVLVEIPMADSLADSERLVELQRRTGLTAMVCHTRRFNPGHVWIRERIESGEFTLQHLVVQTFFFRRTNTNALGKPRGWTDSLLWHHACHTVDLAYWMTDDPDMAVIAHAGPRHPELGIPMDMTVGLKSAAGVLTTLALSFNNRGPFGSWFRYIGNSGTYRAFRDELLDHEDKPIGPSGNGMESQARDFIEAIRSGREPRTSLRRCLPTMKILHRIEQQLG